jgi:hypothetical protein
MGKETVGASELDEIQQAVSERFVGVTSPASIARTLADHGAHLGHPEILAADARWRERQQLFTPEDLTFRTLDEAIAFIEKIDRLRKELEKEIPLFVQLQRSVRAVKTELEWLAARPKEGRNSELAGEVAQWLNIWLQNPPIFNDWLALRRATPDFRERFLAT